MVPLSTPNISGNEWKYIKECLDTGWVSSAGKFVDTLEEKICALTGSKHAIVCVNGTAALQIALNIAGVIAGDEVLVPTVSFIASINAVKYLGADPVFFDCDEFYNLDVKKVAEFIENDTEFKDGFTVSKHTKRIIRAIIPVHVFGNAVDLEEIIEICSQRNIKIIEDSAESIGTYYTKGNLKDKHTGAVGDLGCFSFNGNKIITAGGGGAIVTDNDLFAKRAKYLTTQAKDDEVNYVHNEIGYNFRLTNIQAAMCIAQLERLEDFIGVKHANYDSYKKHINKIKGLILSDVPSYARNNQWMYALRVEDAYSLSREELQKKCLDKNVQVRPLWYLNHLQKPYKNYQSYKIEMAPKLWKSTLNIPCSTHLTAEQIERVIEVLGDA